MWFKGPVTTVEEEEEEKKIQDTSFSANNTI